MSTREEPRFVPYAEYREYAPGEMRARVDAFERDMQRRRTVRQFSDRPVPRELIEKCLLTAGSAPSGAHQQPWHFVAIEDPAVKARIRSAAEAEEQEFYRRRATPEWLEALRPLGTDAHKPYLEVAPWLIAVFLQRFSRLPDGRKVKHYYTDESVGIAVGFLLAAIQQAGLASLTHTPSPMGFLNEVLDRPKDLERAFMLVVVGHPAEGAKVPDIRRKPLADFVTFR